MSHLRAKPKVLIIGALPPPAIGPTIAMQVLLNSNALNEACDVVFVDTTDARDPATIGRFDWMNLWLGLKQAVECGWRLIMTWPAVVYLGVSQGLWGYLRDLAFIIPSLLFRRRVVIHLRGSEFRTFYTTEMPAWLRWITRRVFARAARVILLGNNLRAIFQGLVAPERIAVVPNGIAYEQFFRSDVVSKEGALGKRLLFLSSLRKRKGILVLLEALPLVFERFPDASLTIAGLWQDEHDRATAMSLIQKHNLSKRVTFVGEITGSDKARLFSEHDIFVFTPVEPEGLPWVILEAMSSSLPVITCDQGAIVEVVENEKTGLIITPTASILAENICRLIANPDEARRMGGLGRKRVESRFSEKAYLSSLVNLFCEVAQENAGETIAAASERRAV
jgi:glycosyltransferase involved in cell wall biosynthesis